MLQEDKIRLEEMLTSLCKEQENPEKKCTWQGIIFQEVICCYINYTSVVVFPGIITEDFGSEFSDTICL